jgi:Deoxyribonuclease NucA/NucB
VVLPRRGEEGPHPPAVPPETGERQPQRGGSSFSRLSGHDPADMAAKGKSWLGEFWRPLAALLLWVLGMVPLIAAPPLLPSLAETRVGGVTAFPVDCIPAAPLYPSDLHRVCGPPLEEVASGSPVAPKSGAKLPTVEFDYARHPELADNIWNAQRAGHPNVLTHGGDAAANRAASLESVPNIRPLSRDEYPFASSMEGGSGAWVGHVPVAQQNSQGGILSNFFRRNGIQAGDQYGVQVINHPGGAP